MALHGLEGGTYIDEVAAIVAGGRILVRPVFRFIAKAELREVFTAASLLLVICIALAMQSVGLSPAARAFRSRRGAGGRDVILITADVEN